MKTAMTELIEWGILNAFNIEGQDGTKYVAIDYEEMKDQFDYLLEKEKQQIIEAFELAYMHGYRDNGKSGEKYYNETFTQPIETKDLKLK